MNSRETIPGLLRFGTALSGRGIAVQLEPAPGAMPDKKLRSGGDLAKGPNGEDLPTRRASFEIRITGGGTDGKYSWEQVHPTPEGVSTNVDGGSTDAGTFAYERMGRTDVPVGLITEAVWSDLGPFLLFSLGSGGDAGVWLRVTDATGDSNGDFPAVILINNGDGTRSDGDEVRYRLIDGAGDCVVLNGIYWATLNGTSEDGEETFSLYDGVGNDSENVTDCQTIEEVPTDGYRVWKVPHPWSVGEFVAGDPP